VTTYTYQGSDTFKGQQVELVGVAVDTKIDPTPDASAQIEIKDQKSEGVIHFDNAQGRLVDNESTTTMKMKITVNGMAFDQETTIKSTIKRKAGK
jgi:hypothetical protein